MVRMNSKTTTKEKASKLDQPLTLGGFLDGLDRFYEGKIEPRFVSIESRLSEHDEKFDEIYNHIDGLYKKFDDLQIEYFAIKAALDRIEKYIKQDVEDKKILRQEINKIKSDIHSLSIRIEELEKQIAI